jgi:hypothetical protein
MDPRIVVGTGNGLWVLEGQASRAVETFAGRAVSALGLDGPRIWALVDGSAIWEYDGAAWMPRTAIEGPAATCVTPARDGVLIGTEQAHLFQLDDAGLTRVEAFETVDGRETWYTPWGDPADVRSIAIAGDGAIHVNVHVGGVARSRDGGVAWAPTVDIEQDVHQVLAHPSCSGVVLVASAEGFGVSRDGGDSWAFETAGLHAHYARAVAVADEWVLLSVSTGPRGRRAAIYRRPLDDGAHFERCRAGLPEWFDDNVDTGCLAAAGRRVVCGTADGRVYRSDDAGGCWELALKGLPAVRCVAVA